MQVQILPRQPLARVDAVLGVKILKGLTDLSPRNSEAYGAGV
jgi:hypothetical protein